MSAWQNIEWWYVNLASRTDRRAHAEAEFAKVGITPRRLEGFTPAEWPGDPAQVERMRRRTPGAIGCWQSQQHCIRTGAGENRIVAVCEDDVCFCDDLPTRLAYLEQHLTWDWDIFWLGATFHCNPAVWHRDTLGRDVERTSDPRILRTYGIWSTYAYLVNGTSVQRVCRLLDENRYRSDGIDHCAILYLEPVLNTFCFVPGCAWQYDNRSDIGNGITAFSGFKKLGPYAWQKRMEDFDPDTFDWAEAAR